jgi:hypothetical protein
MLASQSITASSKGKYYVYILAYPDGQVWVRSCAVARSSSSLHDRR